MRISAVLLAATATTLVTAGAVPRDDNVTYIQCLQICSQDHSQCLKGATGGVVPGFGVAFAW